MEMEKVPEAGYRIEGLPVRGLKRKLTLENVKVLYNLWKSLRKARKIIREFKPDAVVGVGGYASGPIGRVAAEAGIPLILQEQNSYAGVTNKLLAKKACKKTILVTGGSLGAGTLNKAVMRCLKDIGQWQEVQVLWQCGSYYYEDLKKQLDGKLPENVKLLAFLKRMDLAYAAADIVVARAGAGTISELCLLEKAAVLIPSPNVAEDHQTKNAMALVDKGAAVMIRDTEAEERLEQVLTGLLSDEKQRKELEKHIAKLAIRDSDEQIAREILKVIG